MGEPGAAGRSWTAALPAPRERDSRGRVESPTRGRVVIPLGSPRPRLFQEGPLGGVARLTGAAVLPPTGLVSAVSLRTAQGSGPGGCPAPRPGPPRGSGCERHAVGAARGRDGEAFVTRKSM